MRSEEEIRAVIAKAMQYKGNLDAGYLYALLWVVNEELTQDELIQKLCNEKYNKGWKKVHKVFHLKFWINKIKWRVRVIKRK